MRTPAALLDWDDSLHLGITLLPWVDLLVRYALFTDDNAALLHELYARNRAGELRYEVFAKRVVEAYAAGLRGQLVADVVSAAFRFVHDDRGRVFTFVQPMLDTLREHGITTILVSGCPQEVLDAYHVRLRFDQAFGMTVRQSAGIYTGQVGRNSALEHTKEEIVSAICRDYRIVVALGNTDSDWPLLKWAELPLVLQSTSAVTGWIEERARAVTEDEVVARIKRFLSDLSPRPDG